MTFSVNTNPGADIALQQLSATNRQLQETQSRINTGLKVASAKDNGAIFAIAQERRAELAGYGVVSQSLDRAVSTVDVALAAGDSISSLLIELKEKALSAKDSTLTAAQRNAYNEDFKALRDQIATIASNAEFNGVNLVDNTTTSFTALANEDGSNTITVNGQNLSLGATIVTLAVDQEVDTETKAGTALTSIEASITNVNKALATLGTQSKALEVHSVFIGRLSDALETGIGNLVDANLAKESANLQALQTKQQLGAQALAIANSASSIVLSFFR